MFCLILVMQTLQRDVVISPCAVEGSSLPPWPYMAFMLLPYACSDITWVSHAFHFV